MRKIEAVIRKSKFKDVKRGLIEANFNLFTYSLVRSISESSEKKFYRGVEFDSSSSDRISLNLYVNYTDVSRAVQIIAKSGTTGDADDARIYVFEVKEALKIDSTGDKDIVTKA